VPEFQPPQINEIIKTNYVDRQIFVPEYQPPVEKEVIVEKIVERPIYVPEYQPPIIKEVINERVVDRPIYIEVEKRVELPVEKIKDKVIERKVLVEREVPYDKIVYIDKPVPYTVPSDPIFQTVEVEKIVDGPPASYIAGQGIATDVMVTQSAVPVMAPMRTSLTVAQPVAVGAPVITSTIGAPVVTSTIGAPVVTSTVAAPVVASTTVPVTGVVSTAPFGAVAPIGVTQVTTSRTNVLTPGVVAPLSGSLTVGAPLPL